MSEHRLASVPVPLGDNKSRPWPVYFWLLLGLLIAIYGIGFYYDVRLRDSFTWMDPGEYYQFAASVVGAQHDNGQFNVPTIFPFCIAPFLLIGGVSITSALWINILFLIILCLVLCRLCHQFEITFHPLLVVAAVLSSPLVIGLSRELYIELPLTAVSALVFSLWFDERRQPSLWRLILFAVAFGFGFMMKLTFPLFFAGPLAVEACSLLRDRKYSQLLRGLAAFCIPVVIVATITFLFFKQSFGYYTRIANTSIPVTKLVGPGSVFSTQSFLYYVSDICKCMLFLLTPLLLPSFATKESRAALGDRKAVMLWAWLLGPLLLLTLVEHKEPRHFAPCIIPIMLLLFKALSTIRSPATKKALGSAVIVLCVTQYLLVTNHIIVAPYYLDRASQFPEILSAMKNNDPTWKPSDGSDENFQEFCWLRTRNIALMGFDPNMALSLAWNLRPAVVFDVDLFKESPHQFNDMPRRRFEDLFYYSSSSIYNRRCLCQNFYQTLDKETILTNADYILVSLRKINEDEIQMPGFHSAGVIRKGSFAIQLMVANTGSRQSYRAIYERELLRSGVSFTSQDLAAIYFDLAIDDSLHQNFSDLTGLFNGYPLQQVLGEDASIGMRNIYWLADDIQFKEVMKQYLSGFAAQQLKSEQKPQ